MAGWSAAASAAADFAGDYFGGMSSARKEYTYAKKMYKKRYQWQVKDLKAAGLNPMLSYMNPAPLPDSPSVDAKPDSFAQTGIRAYSAKKEAALIEEQTNLARTGANKTRAEAEGVEIDNTIKRADPLYQNAVSALGPLGEARTSASAQARFDATTKKMQSEADAAETAAKTAGVNLQRAENDRDRERALRPMIEAHADYVNRGLKLGLSEKEADAQFYEMLGGWAKGSGLMAEAAKLYMMYLKLKGSP